MARRTVDAPAPGRRNLNQILRYAVTSALMLVFAVAAIAAYHKTEAFLISDARFTLAGPGESGEESAGIRLHGAQHAPRNRVMEIFEPDYGRSIYLAPLAERRRQLLAVEWVRDVSIRRTWPDRLDVYLSERQPVAFLQVPTGHAGMTRLALIDGDGVVLEPPAQARYHLPLVSGIRRDQTLAVRREGVRRMLRLLAEIGGLADRVSEIDVADPDNLRVTEQVDGRTLTLLLGNRGFRQRLEKFHGYYPEIRAQLGDAATLDLRIENRIFTVKGEGNAR